MSCTHLVASRLGSTLTGWVKTRGVIHLVRTRRTLRTLEITMESSQIDATAFAVDAEFDTLDNILRDAYEHHASYQNSLVVSQMLGAPSHVVGEAELLTQYELDSLMAIDAHDWMD